MPRLSLVHPWPAQGRADRLSGEDRVEDAGVRAMRSVAELYGEALAGLAIEHRISEIRVFTAHIPGLSVVEAVAHVDPLREGPETGHVRLPTAYLSLTTQRRAATALDALHRIVLRLAEARGWDAPLDRCRDHVLAAGMEYRWDGPWKASPDRRLQARARFRMLPDGYGRARLEVSDRATGEVVATSGEGVAFCTSQGFRRAASSLRWHGSDRVDLVPYDYVPDLRGGEVSLHRTTDGWHSSVRDHLEVLTPPPGDPDAPPLVVVGRGAGVHAPEEPPRLVYHGGGPTSWRVDGFDRHFRAGMRRLCGPAGQAWWQDAGISGSVTIWYSESGTQPHVRGRLVGEELRVVVERPAGTLVAGDDHADEARDDVAAVAALLRRRTGLGPHPELPEA